MNNNRDLKVEDISLNDRDFEKPSLDSEYLEMIEEEREEIDLNDDEEMPAAPPSNSQDGDQSMKTAIKVDPSE